MTPDGTASPLAELSPGATFGEYRISRLLGRGGMGAVYEAVHETDGRVVALKLLSVDLDQMDARQRFLREGRAAAAINHPNAVYIYGTEEIAGTPAITMELVPGGTLDEKVKTLGPLPVAEVVEDIVQVIDGLDAALIAGILHRDVKPANCFVSASGVVKIGDFGLSKPVDGEEQLKLTRTGVFLGTPVFSSPEQLLGETLDARSDIYAVGVTFYYLLTGKLPYQSGSMMQVVAAVLNGEPSPLSAYRPDLPQGVVDVVTKAIARKAADRYQSYDEFRAAVIALRTPETVPAALWDRVRAAVVDLVVVSAIVWVLFWGTVMLTGAALTPATPQGLKLNFALGLVIALLVMGIPEGLLGMSIGKWLVGIRVARVDGQVPGLARSVGRVAIFQSIAFLGLLAQIAPVKVNTRAWLAFIAAFVLRALLAVTMRRSNGWMMLQDWATGTRVLRRQSAAQSRHGATQQREAPVLAGNESHLGPYAVLGPVHGQNGVLHGWDASMQRSVWIILHQRGTPEVSQARRELSRLTRLRWVAGRRSADQSWDAYEAPLGEPLASRVAHAVPWSVQQEWMLDLTGELVAATGDGTMPASLNAASLWVTPADRILVPESAGEVSRPDAGLDSGPVARADARTTEPRAFVQAVSALIRSNDRDAAPLPRHASDALRAAAMAASVDEIHALFEATVGRPTSISRIRRSGLIAATIGTVLLVPVLAIVPIRQQAKSDPEGRKFSGLLQFVGDSVHAHPDSLRPKIAPDSGNLMARFNRALEKGGWFPTDTALNRLSPQEYRSERRLAQVYIAATFARRIHDSLSTAVLGRSPPEQRLAKSILRDIPSVDSSELRAARTLVDSTWRGNPPGTRVDLLLRVIGAVLFVFIPWFVAACAIVIAIVARRGLLMRGFQIDIVTRDGAPAGRARILLRNVVTWGVLGAPMLMYLAADAASPARAGFALSAVAIVSVLVVAVGIAIAIRTPARGLADLIAGTWLVSE